MGQEGDEGGAAAVEHGAGVDVEELRVEGEGPEVAFRGRGRRVATAGSVAVGEVERVGGAGEEGGAVGLDLGVGARVEV